MDILALFQCLQPYLVVTTLRQFSRIAVAMMTMTGRVTMLGISRWAGTGGSYRTVQRFFYNRAIPWAVLCWMFFRQHLHHSDAMYLLAGDEVVVTKAGKQTYGLDRFFSSLYGKAVPGLSFFALSLVSVQERHAFPVRIEQVIRSPAEKAASQAKRQKAAHDQRRPGRPKGSLNKNKAEARLTPELLHIQSMVVALLKRIDHFLPLTYLVLDGHFGNHHAGEMVRQCGLHLISKLRHDSALYWPYAGTYAGHGPHRKYGSRLDYRHIPAQYLKVTTLEGPIQTRIYQAQLLHKEFSQPLNVVIIIKANQQTQAGAQVVLFSTDLKLTDDQIIDYYSLRFQIEFNFRDAKQYWGLEDFMNVTETAVTNAANLSFFMINVSHRLLSDLRPSDSAYTVLDLKAQYRGYKYVTETIQLLPQKPEPVLLAQIFKHVATLGRIHTAQTSFSPG